MTQKPAGSIQFNEPAPHIDPRVTNPAVREYQQRMASRRAPNTLPKYGESVNGGPSPHIPRLDLQHVEGKTMAEQARPSILEPPTASMMSPSGGAHPNILPTDLLPPDAQIDPMFQQGFGAMYAQAQPALAMKYGVVRGNQRLSPQQLVGNVGKEGQQVRPETLKDLEMLQQLQEGKKLEERAKEAEEERQRLEADQAAQDSPASAAKNLSKTAASIDTSGMDAFDLESLHNLMAENELNTKEQRDEIEKRVSPIDLADLIMSGRVRQTIPIVPGTFEPILQNLSPEDDLACKRLIVSEAKGIDIQSERYLLDKYALMGLTCSLVRVHKSLPDLPGYLDNNGDFDEKLFWVKFKKVVKLPLPMIASLGVHFSWFDSRLRRMFRVEKIKNG